MNEARDSEEGKMRRVSLRLKESQFAVIDEAVRLLKLRGVVIEPQEFLSPILEGVTSAWIKRRVEALTPPEYILEIARDYPEVMKVLTTHAKRLVESAKKGDRVALRVRKKKDAGVDHAADEARS